MSYQNTIKNPFFLLISFVSFSTYAQRESTYHAEASAIVGTEQTPFWMRANKYGMVPIKGNTAVFSIGTYSDYQTTKSKINWGYGLNVGAFAGSENKFIIQEAYFKAKWKAVEFYAGRRKEIQGLVDTTLSSGSYIWSGNALPMPKVQISIPDYISLGGEGLISIKGNYAHGWFDNGRKFESNVLLHQKSLYFQFGKPNFKLKFFVGGNHQVQWGGKSSIYPNILKSFKDYLSIITARSNVGRDTLNLSNIDEGNRTGNHLGSFDFGFNILFDNCKLFFYRQNIFEDGSLFYLNNISDGLNGISIHALKNLKNISAIKLNFEFLNTLSQGGKGGYDAKFASQRGQDEYFNNGQYFDGWSYNKVSIGTPFILSVNQFPNQIVQKYYNYFSNNRIQAYYLGFSGKFKDKYDFKAKYSFSKNWGTYTEPFDIRYQSSLYLKLNKNIAPQNITIDLSFATDFGNLFYQNFAVKIGVKKSWSSLTNVSHQTHKHSNNH
jgi:Capsule assembly protein Wzi